MSLVPPPPASLVWLRDEAGLRPPAIARLVGVAPDADARWCADSWAPTADEVPLLSAVAVVRSRACARMPDAPARRRWWAEGQRELGWTSPAELLRRGKLGEVLVLLSTPQSKGHSPPGVRWGRQP